MMSLNGSSWMRRIPCNGGLKVLVNQIKRGNLEAKSTDVRLDRALQGVNAANLRIEAGYFLVIAGNNQPIGDLLVLPVL